MQPESGLEPDPVGETPGKAASPRIDYGIIDASIGSNWFDLDPMLGARVARDSPPEDVPWATRKLRSFGRLVGGSIARNAEISDAHPPRLVRYDRWAREVDEIEYHPATLESKRLLWASGYVSGFAGDEDRAERSTPGIVIAASHYLLSQADTGLVCSLGMTSGVARLVEAYAPEDLRADLLTRLRARDLEQGIDGSMFLTERDGGSDLGRTVHCRARDIGDGRVVIDGEKWFCSNLDGGAIVVLARPEGAPAGSSSLGLYLVPRELDDGSRNGIVMRRLKDKLGTRSVPTGEVELAGAVGYALRPRSAPTGTAGDAGGLGRMMEMVNGSRFGVAMMGLGIARRCFLESAIWAHHRRARGRLLVDLPLVREQLVDALADLEAAAALGFECAAAGRRDADGRLRRILVPIAKVRLARLGVEAASAAIELHGGNGYCEDWGLARQLRDAQCHTIWEGTENICSLDVLRAARQDRAHEAVLRRASEALDHALAAGHAFASESVGVVRAGVDELRARFDAALTSSDADRFEAEAVRVTQHLALVTSAALALEAGAVEAGSGDARAALVATRFVRRRFAGGGGSGGDRIAAELGREILAYDGIDPRSAAGVASA